VVWTPPLLWMVFSEFAEFSYRFPVELRAVPTSLTFCLETASGVSLFAVAICLLLLH